MPVPTVTTVPAPNVTAASAPSVSVVAVTLPAKDEVPEIDRDVASTTPAKDEVPVTLKDAAVMELLFIVELATVTELVVVRIPAPDVAPSNANLFALSPFMVPV